MADFTPAPGTRVTVDGVKWVWRDDVTHAEWVGWYSEQVPRVLAHDQPPLTRIAELEELVEHFKRLKDDQINECLKALAESRADMARLARYEALGKEAAEVPRYDGIMNPSGAAQITDKLAAEWRTQQEGR